MSFGCTGSFPAAHPFLWHYSVAEKRAPSWTRAFTQLMWDQANAMHFQAWAYKDSNGQLQLITYVKL